MVMSALAGLTSRFTGVFDETDAKRLARQAKTGDARRAMTAARIPEDVIVRIKTRDPSRRSRPGEGHRAQAPRRRPDRPAAPFTTTTSPRSSSRRQRTSGTASARARRAARAIDWVMKAEGRELPSRRRDPATPARRSAFALSPLDGAPPKRSTRPEARARPSTSTPTTASCSRQVVGYYHATLKESPEAARLPREAGPRRARARSTAFELGYANRTLGYRLPAMNRDAGEEIREPPPEARRPARERPRAPQRLARRPDLRRGRRRSLGVYGRKFRDPTSAPAPPLHLYLPGPAPRRLERRGARRLEEVILCEALIDALTFWCAGLPQRDGELRRGGLHRTTTSPPSRRTAREQRPDRLRPRRGGRQGGARASRRR